MRTNSQTSVKSSDSHGKSSKNTIIRRVLSYLFAFLLSFSLFAISTVGVGRSVLSGGYTKSCLTDAYYNSLLQDLETKASDYTIPTGLEPTVIQNVFDLQTIKQDVNEYITSTFRIRKSSIDTTLFEEKLRSNVLDFLHSQEIPTEAVNEAESDVELDPESVAAYNNAVSETNKAVEEYVSDIMEIYRKNIKLAGLDYLAKAGNEYQKYFPYIFIILILAIALFVFLCMRLHRLPHRGLRFLVYAFSGGFLMTFLLPFVVYINGFYNRLNVSPQYFKEFMVAYIKGTLAQFMIVSQVWLLIAIVLLIIVAVLRKKSLRSKG